MDAQQTRAQARKSTRQNPASPANEAPASPLPPNGKPVVDNQPTASEAGNTVLMHSYRTHPQLKIPQGFMAALNEFRQHLNRIVTGTHRAGLLARLVKSHLCGNSGVEVYAEDKFELVDMLVECIPHHYEEVNDPLDAFDSAVRHAINDAVDRSDKLAVILDAMTTVARGDATLEDIQKAAGRVFEIARADAAYLPNWQRMTDALESRGFTVMIEAVGDTILGPSVDTPETAALNQKSKRAVAALVKAAHAVSERKSRRNGAEQPQGAPA